MKKLIIVLATTLTCLVANAQKITTGDYYVVSHNDSLTSLHNKTLNRIFKIELNDNLTVGMEYFIKLKNNGYDKEGYMRSELLGITISQGQLRRNTRKLKLE